MSEAKDKFEKRMSLLMAANDRETAIKDSVYIDYVIELKEACEGYALAIESQGKVLNNKIAELEQQNDYLIEALIKEVKQSYEDTGSYSNLSMQVLKNITKKTKEEILTGGER